jgi:flagellar hook-associated protein 1 FlgK
MSLSSALSTAMAGLRANQAALAIVSSNVANAQTPGYVAQSVNQIELAGGAGDGASVRVNGVNRQLDQYIQTQLRTETSGGAYADQIANILSQLQTVYGTPGEAGTLESAFSNFTSALQSLSASSGSPSAQSAVLTAAQSLAQQLNATTRGIQTLRSNVEQDIGISVGQANVAMTQIAQINSRLQGMNATDPAAATLMDQRDNAINQLSQLMDIRVVTDNTNQATVFTNSGIQLVGGSQASQMSFNSPGTLDAGSQWNSNPALSGAGTITIKLPNGGNFDMIANNAISSGQIAADLKLRDKTLVQAQAQVDQLAAAISSSLSDITKPGATVTGPPAGFDLDLSGVQPGNSINVTYTDTATNTQHQVTILRVEDPAALPLSNTATADPNDKVVGVSFASGMASIAAQLNAALGGAHLQFSNPSGVTLRVVDDNTAAAVVNAVSKTTTTTWLPNGGAQLPLFMDADSYYAGRITASGSQMTGLAGRITVNVELLGDPSKLTVYDMSPLTASGDTTRVDFLYSQLTSGSFTYSPQTGLGSATTPFRGTISSFMQQFLSLQSNASATATQLQQGQDVVVSTLQQKFKSTAGVSIDTEMANLIALQNSYAANAHVMSVVQSMMTNLMQIQT